MDIYIWELMVKLLNDEVWIVLSCLVGSCSYTGRHEIDNIGKTASMSVLTFFETWYTLNN